MLSHLWPDIRHGGRMLRGHPALSIASILTFGLGIGLATAVFGLALGLALGLLATAPVGPFLYQVHPRDPAVLVTVVITLGATVLAAGFLGVRRSVCLDPAAILGEE